MATESISHPIIISDVPARLDRLPWSRWHWLVVIALGITWVLDGLEVTPLRPRNFSLPRLLTYLN